MGNAMFYCMLRPVFTVRVIRSDGEVLEFEHSVIAKQLIRMYPGHLVVHCSQVSRTTSLGQQRSKLSMMRAEDTLSPGQTYCLLRVPTQNSSKVAPASKSVQGENSKKSKRSKTVTLRGMIFGTANDVRVCDSDIAQQLQQQYVIQYMLPTPAAQQHQQPSGPWRPHLDAIIESPLHPAVISRAQCISMSPLGRQCKPDAFHGHIQQQQRIQ